MIQLRLWQREALDLYLRSVDRGGHALLWEATPGAGKTTAALQLVVQELKRGCKKVVVVVPTAHLKVQWATAALRVNLDLDSNFNTQYGLSRDYDGVAVTYQQVANNPTFFRAFSRQAVVVLDEIHHAGDGLTWGDALLKSFGEAPFVLALSGTAFRSDNSAIPFVAYNKAGESQPDYVYDYSRAIEDGVCRPTAFFTYGGEVSWQEGGRVIEASFTDDLFGSLAARRLRIALDPESGWVEPMLRDAHQMLLETRQTHPDAGGLLVAADQTHARELAKMLAEISGTRPVLTLSDDSDASKKIKSFADSTEMWIVACNMVSEGVDIPRLRVGVYATTISTKMYFRQFLGRMVRVTRAPEGVQVAYVYFPADPRLSRLAEEVESEQKHFLKRREDGEWELPERQTLAENDGEPGWQALKSYNSGLSAVIVNGQQLALFGDPAFAPQPKTVLAQVHEKMEERVQPLTKAEIKANLAAEIKELVGRYHHKTKQPYREIHAYLNRIQKVESQKICTVDQLRDRSQILQELLHS